MIILIVVCTFERNDFFHPNSQEDFVFDSYFRHELKHSASSIIVFMLLFLKNSYAKEITINVEMVAV